MQQYCKGRIKNISSVIIGKINYKDIADLHDNFSHEYIRIVDNSNSTLAILSEAKKIPTNLKLSNVPIVYDINNISNFMDGDIVSIMQNGSVTMLFKQDSIHNSIFVTDQCNNRCIMCSQPPKKNKDINLLHAINMKLIDLLPNLPSVGITGGEPTLLKEKLYFLIEKISNTHPQTLIHVLTNARLFSWINYTRLLASINSNNIIYAIPFFSDNYIDHELITTKKNSFSQSLLGLYNLAKYDQRIELRIILQKYTVNRLIKLAQFICLNLPFVEHIVFMGLELLGYAQKHSANVWTSPSEYTNQLSKAIEILTCNKYSVSIYNLPLCVLPDNLWPFCEKAITEWKNKYLNECELCIKRDRCGGIFSSTHDHYKNLIQPLT